MLFEGSVYTVTSSSVKHAVVGDGTLSRFLNFRTLKSFGVSKIYPINEE